MNEDDSCERIVLDEKWNIWKGKEARERIKSKSDISFFDEKNGVTRISKERWLEALRCEKRGWMEKGLDLFDARNTIHTKKFADYLTLKGMKFENAIELGCGPFTNIRYILRQCAIKNIHLLDPLAVEYQKHPFCSYANRRLGGIFQRRNRSLVLKFLKRQIRPLRFLIEIYNKYRIGRFFGRPVAIENTPIESFEPPTKFDLVVMTNVIEHCQDARVIFDKIKEILAPNGILVYGEQVFNSKDVKDLLTQRYDAAHPIKVDQSLVESFLDSNFNELMRSHYVIEDQYWGTPWKYSELYYVGRRKEESIR